MILIWTAIAVELLARSVGAASRLVVRCLVLLAVAKCSPVWVHPYSFVPLIEEAFPRVRGISYRGRAPWHPIIVCNSLRFWHAKSRGRLTASLDGLNLVALWTAIRSEVEHCEVVGHGSR